MKARQARPSLRTMPAALAFTAIAAAQAAATPPPPLPASQTTPEAAAPAPEPEPTGVARIQRDAAALRPLVTSEVAKRFLDAAASLPAIETRTLHRDPSGRWLSKAEVEALPEEQRKAIKSIPMNEDRYYNTKYGSPLAYVRALDLAATCGAAPAFSSLEGARVLDYGYGTVGHLRLMASLGAHATGVDVDPFLTALYGEAPDTGPVPGHGGAPDGSITLAHGRFPADAAAKETVEAGRQGGGYHLITSKNTLKNGYINPAEPVDRRLLVDLGVGHGAFVRALYDLLEPGGLVVIYNLSPAPSKKGEEYKPWADGRCPFKRELWEDAGFTIIAFDENDDAAARALGRALGWDKGGMNLESDLFGLYTIVQKPPK